MTPPVSAPIEHLRYRLGHQYTSQSFGSIRTSRLYTNGWRYCAFHVLRIRGFSSARRCNRAKASGHGAQLHTTLLIIRTLPPPPHALRPGRARKLESIDERQVWSLALETLWELSKSRREWRRHKLTAWPSGTDSIHSLPVFQQCPTWWASDLLWKLDRIMKSYIRVHYTDCWRSINHAAACCSRSP